MPIVDDVMPELPYVLVSRWCRPQWPVAHGMILVPDFREEESTAPEWYLLLFSSKDKACEFAERTGKKEEFPSAVRLPTWDALCELLSKLLDDKVLYVAFDPTGKRETGIAARAKTVLDYATTRISKTIQSDEVGL